ncbi:DUF5677 domain-containing protein [Zunongwangia sp. F363]|uniref:DUF5677 domain-containing protein n=1 Tax=Autumnicola tepida TaxID=3075595 RepID=A0ABU3CFC6_9FLAO|nr:DUF5677 domain-containing protein [Zunongwangia sp. F363]MDT0644953.1 DUF5677 domain-containing protein [Zunongwangia sp. F363]
MALIVKKNFKYNDPPDSIIFGSKEHLEWGQVALFEQTKILQEVHDRLLDPKDSKKMIMAMSIISIKETSRSILLLARNSVRDSYALSRILLDATLNLGYYSVDDKMIDKAIKYSHQKSFRDLFRDIDPSTLEAKSRLTEISDFKVPNNLKKAFEEFTSKKGNEIRNWYGEPRDNVYKRIEKIEKVHGKDMGKVLNFCLFSIYRHASEIIHATFFGTNYGIGFTNTREEMPKNDEEYKIYIYKMNSYLMSVLNLLIETSIRIIDYDFHMEDLVEKSRGFTNHLTELTTNANIG